MNICPSFACNFDCEFCCTHNKPGKRIDLDWIGEQFSKHPNLAKDIDILGGEPSILPFDYQKRLIEICTKHAGQKPYFTTNLFKISPFIDKVIPIVSFDFSVREHSSTVLNNMISLNVPYSISMIVTNHIVENLGAKKLIQFADSLKNCFKIDLLVFMKRGAAIDLTPNRKKLFEFFEKVMQHKKFSYTPYLGLCGIYDSSFDDISNYLTFLPNNKFGFVLRYDNDEEEVFDTCDTYEEAEKYFEKRIKIIHASNPCSSCEYIGKCGCAIGYKEGHCYGDKELLDLFPTILSHKNSPWRTRCLPELLEKYTS